MTIILAGQGGVLVVWERSTPLPSFSAAHERRPSTSRYEGAGKALESHRRHRARGIRHKLVARTSTQLSPPCVSSTFFETDLESIGYLLLAVSSAGCPGRVHPHGMSCELETCRVSLPEGNRIDKRDHRTTKRSCRLLRQVEELTQVPLR